jgi:ribonucleoside-diphosphate reductase alpha chain
MFEENVINEDPISELKFLSKKFPSIDLAIIEKKCSTISGYSYKDQYSQLALLCQTKALVHPDWLLLSGQIKMKYIKNIVPKKFSESTFNLKSILHEDYYKFIMENKERLDNMINEEEDMNFNLFAVETLAKSYLARIKKDSKTIILETPQYMYLRVSTYLWFESNKDNKEKSLIKIEKMYNEISLGKYSMASPTMFNAGLFKSQLASCFIYNVGDSIQSISKGWHDSAIISMNSGGLGIDFTSLRHSEIGQHGETTGIIPWIKITAQILLTVDQGSKRKGSGTAYLCCWHIDIEEFLDLKKSSGPEDMRAREMFYALWISDEFMRRVESDEDWTLFCPNKVPKLDVKWGMDFEIAYRNFEKKVATGKIVHFRVVKARELWKKIILTQIETGMPFILYKDAINRKSNQKNLGTTRLSNLCVDGDTFILTDQGNIPIRDITDKKVNIWNGKEWSEVIPRKTGENKNLLTVKLSNGVEINCTPEHKFYVEKSYQPDIPLMVDAQNLTRGVKLIKYSLPKQPIVYEKPNKDFLYPYTHGFFTGCGSYDKGHPVLNLSEEKKLILSHINYKTYKNTVKGGINVILRKDLNTKFEVPHRSSVEDRIKWISGYADSKGVICINGEKETLKITSIHKVFLLEVRLLLQTLGIDSEVIQLVNTKEDYYEVMYSIIINSYNLWMLQIIGLDLHHLKLNKVKPNMNNFSVITVKEVISGPQNVDTFCFTENKRNMGMFNGILAGNCTEITLFTDKDNIASCNLGSIVLNSCIKYNNSKPFYDFEELENLTRSMIRNVNQMIDRNYYPQEVPQIKYTNLRNRPIGVGVQGLADVFAILDLPWTSIEARKLNEMIFETMYYASVSETVKMAKESGAYETFRGSPASEGLFQFDLWDLEKVEKEFESKTKEKPFISADFIDKHLRTRKGSNSGRYDWESLRIDMVKYGMKNSMLMALMPTASSASILGNNEAMEAYTQHIYTRTVLSGQFVMINKHLVKDFKEINMWNTDVVKDICKNNGSIADISEDISDLDKLNRLKFLKEKYLTSFEIPQKVLLDMSLDRGRYICQTQSFNCWMKEPTFTRLNAFHFYGWKGGAKTGMYYLRQTAKTNPINFSIDSINIKPSNLNNKNRDKIECDEEVCVSCSS